MRVYVSREPISQLEFTRLYRLPLGIRVPPTYWVRVNEKNSMIPLNHKVTIEDISILKYLWLCWRNRRVLFNSNKSNSPTT